MAEEITHRGWDWTRVEASAWNEVAPEFLPVALRWAKRCKTMLDIGAGRGRNALFMAGLGLRVTAVDLSQSGIGQLLSAAAAAGHRVDAQAADMTALPFHDAAFDCAVCFHVLYHTDFRGMQKAVAELRRVLRPGGEAFITFNAKENPSFSRGTPVDGRTIYKTEGLEKDVPHTYVDWEDIRALLADFDLLEAQKTQEYVYRGAPSGGVHYFVLAKKR